jgi:flagellar basal body-associated protein FliL
MNVVKKPVSFDMAKTEEQIRKERKGKIIGWIIFILLVLLISGWAWISFLTG